MFCSIEDAWGEKEFVDKPLFKQSDKPEHFTNESNKKISEENKQDLYSKYIELKEIFESNKSNDQNEPNEPNDPNELNEHFGNNFENYNSHLNKMSVCLALDAHLSKCNRCRLKYLSNNNHKPAIKKNSLYTSNSLGFDLSNLIAGLHINKDIIWKVSETTTS